MISAVNAMPIKIRIVERFLIGLMIVAICTINLGVDEFVSTQFFVFVLMLMLLVDEAIYRVADVLLLGVVYVGLVCIAAIGGDHQFQLVARGLRTGFIIILLYLIQSKASRPLTINWGMIAHQSVYWACIASAILASGQLVDSLTRNSGFADLPVEWFALEYNTIFTDLRQVLASVGFFVRPTAFFSEPSALAALSVLGLLIAYNVNDFKLKLISVYVAFISCSLLGILFTLVYIFYRETTKQKSLIGLLGIFIVIAVLVLGVAVSGGTGNEVIDRRLANVFSGEDISSEIRMVAPLYLIAHIFSEYNYLGVDYDVASSLVPEHLTTVFSNWIFNQFIYYGIFGIFFVFIPFLILRKEVWILLFMYMNANGDAFYYDRFFYLSLAILACCGTYNRNSVRAERQP